MELNGAKILYTIHTDIPLLGDFKISQTLVSTWIVMALLSGLAIWLGRNLKLENVSKRQAAAEFIVERLDQFVHDNKGYHFDKYIPLIGAIFAQACQRPVQQCGNDRTGLLPQFMFYI